MRTLVMLTAAALAIAAALGLIACTLGVLLHVIGLERQADADPHVAALLLSLCAMVCALSGWFGIWLWLRGEG